jgi:hypothetical protein
MTVQTLSRGHDSESKPFGMREVFIGGTRCLDNGRVVIGSALTVPKPPEATRYGELLQRALLDKRTAQTPSALARLAGALWRWA